MSKETYADFLNKMEKGADGVQVPWFQQQKQEGADNMNPDQIWSQIQRNAREQFPEDNQAMAISQYLASAEGSELYDQYLQAKDSGTPSHGTSEGSEPPAEPSEPMNMTKAAQIQKAALDRLDRLAKERQELKKGAISYAQAYSEILDEQPHLYTAARPHG